MTKRTNRIDELLREEIGRVLAREVSDPRIGFATITAVETTPDLRHAKVWVSVIGQPGDRTTTLAALRRAMPFVRRELGVLRLKRIPDLHVELDDTAERGTRVLRLLDDLEQGQPPAADGPLGESLPTPVPRLPHEGDAAVPDEPPFPPESPRPRSRRRPGPRDGAGGRPTGHPPRRRR